MIRRAVSKYGKENFSREIIEWCDTEDNLNLREKYWILELNSRNLERGYNVAYGGNGGKNYDMTDEIRNKISVMTKLAMNNDEVRKKVSNKCSPEKRKHLSEINKGEKNPNWGTHWTEERKLKAKITRENSEKWENFVNTIGDKLRGVKKSDEHRKHISESKKGKPGNRVKKIYYILDGEIKYFNSIKDGSKWFKEYIFKNYNINFSEELCRTKITDSINNKNIVFHLGGPTNNINVIKIDRIKFYKEEER